MILPDITPTVIRDYFYNNRWDLRAHKIIDCGFNVSMVNDTELVISLNWVTYINFEQKQVYVKKGVY